MDFRTTEPGSDGSKALLDLAAEGVALSVATELPRGVSEALADPIVKALMAADRVDPKCVEDLFRRTAAWLAQRDLQIDPRTSPDARNPPPAPASPCLPRASF
jgi:hypothetical protein